MTISKKFLFSRIILLKHNKELQVWPLINLYFLHFIERAKVSISCPGKRNVASCFEIQVAYSYVVKSP